MEDTGLSEKGRSERLLELSVFLRHVRTRTTPTPDECDMRRARRTQGLRREEVAARAGISTDWYTRIEQGRDVNPSREVLAALGDALEMSASERDYLRALTDQSTGQRVGPPNDASGLALLADQMPLSPAFVLDPAWNVMHQNHASIDKFGDWLRDGKASSNFLVRFFTDPMLTNGIEDWDRHARLTVRQYRAVFAKRIDDPTVQETLRVVSNCSQAFRDCWSGADVAGRDDGLKVFVADDGEQKIFDYVMVRHCEASDCELIAFIPRT
ncbi:MAG: helix-turn-helix transcriptional regulator [Pseudomonadota bacterium]